MAPMLMGEPWSLMAACSLIHCIVTRMLPSGAVAAAGVCRLVMKEVPRCVVDAGSGSVLGWAAA